MEFTDKIKEIFPPSQLNNRITWPTSAHRMRQMAWQNN